MAHQGYARVFQPGHLTFGFIAPLESYPDSPGPTLEDHAVMARKVDDAGFAALWLRDVPFYDPQFGDVGQILDPLVYAGYLAAVTQRITIGTAGIVLPLRDPLIVAKQAASIDQLLGGRFILGLATGDRPVEYPAFGLDFENRAERFRADSCRHRKALGSAFIDVLRTPGWLTGPGAQTCCLKTAHHCDRSIGTITGVDRQTYRRHSFVSLQPSPHSPSDRTLAFSLRRP
jgi:luciferase-type oxidoreductase